LSGNDFKRNIERTDYQYAIKNRDSLFNKGRMFLKHKKSDHNGAIDENIYKFSIADCKCNDSQK
ncbi:MAG TPA: hypothetical protein DCO75_06695, partial [Fibrobacteres bacterium]|nr:hypothetical protein [Fibrobacterota bacterium]